MCLGGYGGGTTVGDTESVTVAVEGLGPEPLP